MNRYVTYRKQPMRFWEHEGNRMAEMVSDFHKATIFSSDDDALLRAAEQFGDNGLIDVALVKQGCAPPGWEKQTEKPQRTSQRDAPANQAELL